MGTILREIGTSHGQHHREMFYSRFVCNLILTSVADPRPEPNKLHQSEKPDPDPLQSEKPAYCGAVETLNEPGTVDGLKLRIRMKEKTYLDPYQSKKSDTYPY
jgi:hypothetical protein